MRSSFRDWCGAHDVDRHVAEESLSHAVGDKTERAYRRELYLKQRREALEAWAKHLGYYPEGGNVVAMAG